MNRLEVVKAFAIAAVALPALLLGASITASCETSVRQSAIAQTVPWTAPVPKGTCGRMDRTETGLQGQTTPDERSSGKSERGYNCNLELVGQFQGEGAFSQDGPAFLDNCAYYATENRSGQKHPGLGVGCLEPPASTADRVPGRHSRGTQPTRDAESERGAQAARGRRKQRA